MQNMHFEGCIKVSELFNFSIHPMENSKSGFLLFLVKVGSK